MKLLRSVRRLSEIRRHLARLERAGHSVSSDAVLYDAIQRVSEEDELLTGSFELPWSIAGISSLQSDQVSATRALQQANDAITGLKTEVDVAEHICQ
jgi:hypothetical protein